MTEFETISKEEMKKELDEARRFCGNCDGEDTMLFCCECLRLAKEKSFKSGLKQNIEANFNKDLCKKCRGKILERII